MIADLDSALAVAGTPVTIQRMEPGAGGTVVVAAEVTVQGAAKPTGGTETLTGAVLLSDLSVIVSPTGLANWTGGLDGSGEAIVPAKGNRLIIGGRVMSVDHAFARRVQGQIVRIEIQATG